MAEDDIVAEGNKDENPEVSGESDVEEVQDDGNKDRTGDKNRDQWEKETPFQRSARKAKYVVVVNLQEDKDKAIKEQAKSLYLPLLETEETIDYLKGLPEPKDKKDKAKWVKRIEGLRCSRKILHGRLHELCVANKHLSLIHI